jgi:hypothetical protein
MTLHQSIQATVTAVVSDLIRICATSRKEAREMNRTTRAPMLGYAYALYERDGEMSLDKLYICTLGMTVKDMQTSTKRIRRHLAESKVRSNILDLKLQSALRVA